MSWVTTEICWYFHYSCCSKHLTSHTCALLIDNVGNYLYMYLNNGSFKSEVDPHQFNLRERKKIFKSWQVCDWLAKWLIVLGFMDLRWPRVYRRSNVGLVYSAKKKNSISRFKSLTKPGLSVVGDHPLEHALPCVLSYIQDAPWGSNLINECSLKGSFSLWLLNPELLCICLQEWNGCFCLLNVSHGNWYFWFLMWNQIWTQA